MAAGRKPTTPLAEGGSVATLPRRICANAPPNATRMRASQSLLSASALLLGALAVGNPFLPRRGEVEAAGSVAPGAGLVRRVVARPAFAPLWARDPIQQSPVDMLARLPRLVTPAVTPAAWQPTSSARVGQGSRPEVGIDFQRPQ